MAILNLSYACDVCGGSTSFNLGSPYFNGVKGFLSSSYKYIPFKIYHRESGRITNDVQQEYAASFAWNLSNRFLVGVQQSYAHYYQEVQDSEFKGLKDLSTQLRYQLWKSDSLSKGKGKLNVWLSQIHSLPTGKFYDFERLAQLSPSKNAWIIAHRIDAVYERDLLGIVTNYQFSTSLMEIADYRFGDAHSIAFAGMLKKRIGLSEWKTVSFIGANFQKFYTDLSNRDRGIYNKYSGGELLQAELKLNVLYKQMLFGVNAGLPIYSSLAANSVEQGLMGGVTIKLLID
jgi:hypothetical protein